MRPFAPFRFATLCSVALAVTAFLPSAAPAQVAPFPYWIPDAPFSAGPSGADAGAWIPAFGSSSSDDGNARGFAFRSYSLPVNSFSGSLAGNSFSAFGTSSSLVSDGAQYGYRFKGIGDVPVTLFGGINTLRATPDVFTTLTRPGFTSDRTLATSVQAGIEFKPTSNVSVSFSAGYLQPSSMIEGEPPIFPGVRR